uniref:Uncharacterized protein n=1 Tax=Arundo donax TaxID=35708 RepID=A0A0A9FL13_ARUDO
MLTLYMYVMISICYHLQLMSM